jgi:hypothetical protein
MRLLRQQGTAGNQQCTYYAPDSPQPHPNEMQSTLSPATTQLAARFGAGRPQSRGGPLRVTALAIPNEYGYAGHHRMLAVPPHHVRMQLKCAAGYPAPRLGRRQAHPPHTRLLAPFPAGG